VETFLLTWNPRRFSWDDLDEVVNDVQAEGHAHYSWSCGNTRRIKAGDRLFMIRLGKEDPGLIGSAWAISPPYEEEHWVDEQQEAPRTAWFVPLDWDFLSHEAVIPRSRLDKKPFNKVRWSSQSSGISIAADVASALEEEWGRLLGHQFQPLPEEAEVHQLIEGDVRRISVDRYERDGRARQACIAHYGYSCVVCAKSLAEVYGPAAAKVIHIHHLQPLAEIRQAHHVDPVRDLRPVCPSCHAVIHLKSPPFTIGEVQEFLVAAAAPRPGIK
jgi:5-methylcytosine-specific restriction protein A